MPHTTWTQNPPDRTPLHEALALAELAVGLSEPNPRVGCVITAADGRVLGRGHTQAAGGPHAEVMALRDAAAQGHDVRGATVHVTLEPCAHQGRTPPCADALAAAGVARVVMAMADPNPLVNGQGRARLVAAGIEVVDGPPDVAQAAHELNIGFVSRMTRGRPWVRVKVAASLDGRTALPGGASQWITGSAARRDGHLWRRRAGAVMTGIGTLLADDAQLTVREVPTARQPLRVVVDARLQTPTTARLFAAPDPVLLVTAQPGSHACAEVLPLPGEAGRVDLGALLHALAQRGVNELHVEAGARLNAALFEGGWVDEWLAYIAPVLLGPGLPWAALPELHRLAAAPRFTLVEALPVGDDLRLRLRPATHPCPGR
ncbi:MAG: bifunctional diaminohydroxyphosphoribosylaminopyrimidine deaminase/5-amino-6-(5-phosphoribosylamino)uracil reductase RibD [Proteobacteria bacterium]|nr:bifunctional diaminohydroxyphosphoribosylaminopyrimidine deaminase/5-amino-6-(5-phosphoribosylamino)uracil reductase RibD [Pseudomonadota bacterium]